MVNREQKVILRIRHEKRKLLEPLNLNRFFLNVLCYTAMDRKKLLGRFNIIVFNSGHLRGALLHLKTVKIERLHGKVRPLN